MSIFLLKNSDKEGYNSMLEYIKKINELIVWTIKKKHIKEEYIVKSESWLIKNNDERVVHYETLPKVH